MKNITSLLLFLILNVFIVTAQNRDVSLRQASEIANESTVLKDPLTTYTMDFEQVADFSLNFDPRKVRDIDSLNTFFITGHTFPHISQPMAFISFNPAMVTPAMTDPSIQPHGGLRFGACFSAINPPNNDWFISPKIQLGTGEAFSFWVKSFTSEYGLEKYKVGVSTTSNNPTAFTFISGVTPLLAEESWTKKSFSLSAYDNQQVYVAIQCVSDTAFIFMIDDLEVNPSDSSGQLPSNAMQDFDDVPDFTVDFSPWAVKDVNGGLTYGIENTSFPHNGSPMAYICFNPSKAVPPPINMSAHSGDKFGACFSSQPPNNPNNKWLISPRLELENNAKISLWVQSYNLSYGSEKFNIGVSITGNDPSDFTIISGSKPDSATIPWERKIYDLADYANQKVYVGIQCVTDNGFCFMVDDIEIGSSVNIQEHQNIESLTIYPNPAKDYFTVESEFAPNNIIIVDAIGKMVYQQNTNSTKSVINTSALSKGIYLVKIFGDMQLSHSRLIINR
jgi:hypothetical protein